MKTNIYVITLLFLGMLPVKTFGQADYVVKDTNYITIPHRIALKSYYANVEPAEGACSNEGKHFRIRGLKDGGSVEFTVPDAENVTIVLKGKSTAKDRSVRICRDGECIREYTNLDADNCVTFTENVHRKFPVTYRVTGGDSLSTKPVVLKSIVVQKYSASSKEKETIETEILFYPNPVADVLNINFPVKEKNCRISIYSLTGVKVFEQTITDEGCCSLQVAHLPEGVYMLKFSSGQTNMVKKIIKR